MGTVASINVVDFKDSERHAFFFLRDQRNHVRRRCLKARWLEKERQLMVSDGEESWSVQLPAPISGVELQLPQTHIVAVIVLKAAPSRWRYDHFANSLSIC